VSRRFKAYRKRRCVTIPIEILATKLPKKNSKSVEAYSVLMIPEKRVGNYAGSVIAGV